MTSKLDDKETKFNPNYAIGFARPEISQGLSVYRVPREVLQSQENQAV
jgi:hypothetical protein